MNSRTPQHTRHAARIAIASISVLMISACMSRPEQEPIVHTAPAAAATPPVVVIEKTREEKLAVLREQLHGPDLYIGASGTIVLGDAMFDSGSSILRREAVPWLDPVIAYLRENPDIKVRIEGHTDNRGNVQENTDLSEARASAVGRALKASTLTSNAVESFGMGPSKPLASNSTLSGQAQNRRVVIMLQ